MSQKTNQLESLLSVQNVILASIFWGLLALFIFLLGSPIVPRPIWYKGVTYVLENTAFFAAMLLCLRNWRSSKIVSGRTVWLLFGLGMLCYFAANLLLGWWETTFGFAPDVSPADFLYLFSYLSLGLGMLLAVLSKQLQLTVPQWLLIAAIAIVGVVMAYSVSGYAGGGGEEAFLPQKSIDTIALKTQKGQGALRISHSQSQAVQSQAVQSQAVQSQATKEVGWFAQVTPHRAPAVAVPSPPSLPSSVEITATPTAPANPQEPSPPVDDAVENGSGVPAEGTGDVPGELPTEQSDGTMPPAEDTSGDLADIPDNAPTWMLGINEMLEPFADLVWILYLVGDTFLVVMATTLLLAFWGGRFSLSWRFIAAAGMSLYIADMWYYYAIANIEGYATGALPEVFWIFSGVLFCIGASLEYSLSTRSRRSRRRA